MCALLLLAACQPRPPQFSDPQSAFQSVELDFLHGHLLQAQAGVDLASRQFSAKSPEWAWRFRLLKGDILIKRGLSEEVLALLASQFPPEPAGGQLSIKRFVLLGLACTSLGRVQEADENLKHAEQLSASSPATLQFDVLAARGILQVRQAQLGAAERTFRQALQLARSQNLQFAEAAALLNLSAAAVHLHRYDDAVDWSNAAYERAHNADAGLTEEKALGNLGWAYYQMGDLDRSLSLTLDAEKRARELGIVKDQLRWLYNAGGVYEAQDDLAGAQQRYLDALKLSGQIGDLDQKMNALLSLSALSVKQGHFDLATQYSGQATQLARAQNNRLGELYAMFTQAQIAANRKRDPDAERLFLQVAREATREASLRWQAQDELAGLYARRNQVQEARTQYLNALSTLECARTAVDHEELRLSFLTNGSRVYDNYLRFLVQRGKTDEALQVADYGRAQTLAEGLGVLRNRGACAASVRSTGNVREAARKAGGTVLFYWLGREQSYLWVVNSNRTTLIPLPPAAGIETLVQNYRRALLASGDVLQRANADGLDLYRKLVEPAMPFIARGSRVVIVPDRSLNNLNFETLLVPDPAPHFWIEDVTLANASSLRMLAASRPTVAGAHGRLLLIGDPVVPDPKYPRLPNAAQEMQSVSENFPGKLTRRFTAHDATPLAYLNSQPQQYSYIHFVAHGTASELSPLDSAVVLSKATQEQDSFKLHAREVIAHPLRANLVTISACYGSGIKPYTGEGLVGLSWAFLRAGAHHVVGALWAVSDDSTPRLMEQFYKGLSKGRSPEDALRDAKLSLLHSGGIFRKPFYWAPFQLYNGS